MKIEWTGNAEVVLMMSVFSVPRHSFKNLTLSKKTNELHLDYTNELSIFTKRRTVIEI